MMNSRERQRARFVAVNSSCVAGCGPLPCLRLGGEKEHARREGREGGRQGRAGTRSGEVQERATEPVSRERDTSGARPLLRLCIFQGNTTCRGGASVTFGLFVSPRRHL